MKFICVLIVGMFFGQALQAAPKGHWSGAGGNGFAYAFTNIGYRLHRELLMEPYIADQNQARDEISLPAFLNAVDNTKVVVTSEVIVDRHGHAQTAVYYRPSELAGIYNEQGKSSAEITKILGEMPLGVIVVNEERFQREMASQLPVALSTVFHEYRRVMGLDEDNYRSSASRYNLDFFARIQEDSSALSKRVFEKIQSDKQVAFSKMELIDKEKLRLKSEMSEDIPELEAVLIKRRPYVDAVRKSFSKTMNAYADILETMGFAVMPFPSAHSDTVRAVGKAASSGMDTKQKMSELEVLNLQAEFLTKNVKRNMAFYELIDEQRNKLFLELLLK